MGVVLDKLFAYPSSEDPASDITCNTIVSLSNIFALSFVSYTEGYTNHLECQRLLSSDRSANQEDHDPSEDEPFKPKIKDWKWLICLGLIIILQFLLTILFGTEGFSLVWSALAGWSTAAIKIRKWRSYYLYVILAALVGDVIVLLYYFFIASNLTTTAHLCGIAFGAILGLVYLKPSSRPLKPFFAEKIANGFEY